MLILLILYLVGILLSCLSVRFLKRTFKNESLSLIYMKIVTFIPGVNIVYSISIIILLTLDIVLKFFDNNKYTRSIFKKIPDILWGK